MNIKKYQNELIVLAALFVLCITYFYKQEQIAGQTQKADSFNRSIGEYREIAALQNIWGNKKIASKVDQLQEAVPKTKIKWNKTGKTLTAIYDNLSASELNKLINKMLNLAVEIETLSIKQSDSAYHVEFACKW